MVDLIITDSNHVDVRSAADFTLDCAWGKEENDFELVVSGASTIDAGAYIYVDGSECGGVVDAMEDQLTAGVSTLTYSGRTWHGVLANKILEPDRGRDYLTVSGTASTVIGSLISRVGLDSVFDAVVPPDGSDDPTIKQYQFDRYTDCYTGLRRMCAANGLKLRLAYTSGQVNIWPNRSRITATRLTATLSISTRPARGANRIISSAWARAKVPVERSSTGTRMLRATSARPSRSGAWTR